MTANAYAYWLINQLSCDTFYLQFFCVVNPICFCFVFENVHLTCVLYHGILSLFFFCNWIAIIYTQCVIIFASYYWYYIPKCKMCVRIFQLHYLLFWSQLLHFFRFINTYTMMICFDLKGRLAKYNIIRFFMIFHIVHDAERIKEEKNLKQNSPNHCYMIVFQFNLLSLDYLCIAHKTH